MKNHKLTSFARILMAVAAFLTIQAVFPEAGTVCLAQSPPPTVSPSLQDVVKLVQDHMGDDVILAWIKNSGVSYSLTPDDIHYLTGQGVSQAVITALLQTKAAASPVAPQPAPMIQSSVPPVVPPPAPGPPAAVAPSLVTQAVIPQAPPGPPPGAPPQAVNFGYFHDQLAPYGTWVEVPGYGPCWRPDRVMAVNPDWRPYYDMGRWVQTENGLFWASDYNWGDIPFHYGRWIREPGYGWLWVPDYTWGPAWVFWRHGETDACIGWAPLPYGAVFAPGGWWEFRGRRVEVGFEFGLGEEHFVFVGYEHFHEPFFRLRGREFAYHIHQERIHEFYHRTIIRNEFRRDEHGRFVNEGIGRERLERVTNHRVEQAHFQERQPTVRAEHEAAGRAGPQPAKQVAQAGQATQSGKGQPAQEAKAPAAQETKVFRPPATSQSTAATPRAAPAARPAPASKPAGASKK
jgi:hypothetical protein